MSRDEQSQWPVGTQIVITEVEAKTYSREQLTQLVRERALLAEATLLHFLDRVYWNPKVES